MSAVAGFVTAADCCLWYLEALSVDWIVDFEFVVKGATDDLLGHGFDSFGYHHSRMIVLCNSLMPSFSGGAIINTLLLLLSF